MKTYLQFISIVFLFIISFSASAQTNDAAKKYTIAKIAVEGNSSYSEETIITYSGLRKGQRISVPGDETNEAIKKLWKSNLFNNIELYVSKLDGDLAELLIKLTDVAILNEVKVTGLKKRKVEKVIKENKLEKGVKVTENLVTTTKNYLENKYKKDGFYNAKVNINTIDMTDTTKTAKVNMVVAIDKGTKVKVQNIDFNGNSVLSGKKLRKAMKNTKKKNPIRLFKRSKYIEANYKEDLISVVDKYKEKGYRDARIVSENLTVNDDKTVSLNITVEEGELYKFGKITFIGNTVFTDRQLNSVLRINEGDTYNGVLLEKRIEDTSSPDADDLTNLYQNSGYLFSSINPVEVSTENNVIDMEIRILEGKPAYFNNVTVVGNEKTNDHVIYRELRTRPGQLYRKSDVVRTIRELSQLGFFDAEKLETNFKNVNANEGTLDMEYSVEETGSSQIELQGGYGGGGFIGTLGLSFSNFSIKNIFNKDAYTPIPMGDGQKLSLRLQASRFFRTYSFSFIEPWLGGKKPVQFSSSISYSKQFLFNSQTGGVDKDKRFTILGLSVGIAKRLSVPDDYFTVSQAVGFQHYSLNNYNTSLFTFGDGFSNNLSYTIGLSRNNTAIDPIFPTQGSSFSVSAKLSLPYSLFNKTDYKALADERSGLNTNDVEDRQRLAEIDQERFKWLEFYKIKFRGDWYTRIIDKLVLRPSVEFGFLGAYNQDRGVIPFERFFVGGDGLGQQSLDGRETIALRGYPNQSLQPVDENGNVGNDGASIYNKFSLELRYPITLKQSAKIYALSFLEGGAAYNDFKSYNPFDVSRSAGLGVRIFMPAFGLLGIDFGYGFDPVPGQGTQKSGWETHFIIGQQF